MIAARVAARYNAAQVSAKAERVLNRLTKERARLWRELLQFYQHQSYGKDPNPQKAQSLKARLLKQYTSLRDDIAAVVQDARALADKLKVDKAIPPTDEERYDDYLTFRIRVESLAQCRTC